MRKTLLALATGSVTALSAGTAAAEPQIYGKANISYENVDTSAGDAWELQSNSSRIGIRGDVDLDVDQLKGIYQAEFGVAFDDGNSGGETFSQRNIFAGFEHEQLGILKAGRFDTPMKTSQGDVDMFGNLAGDIGAILAGENRASDIVQYSSPSLADNLQANVALIPGGEQGGEDDGPADAISSSVVYDDGTVYGALAYDSEIEEDLLVDSMAPGSDRINILRATGQVRLGEIELGGIIQQAEDADGDGEELGYLMSAGFNVDKLKLKAQYGLADADSVNNEATLLALGADYRIGSQSKVFTYYSDVDPDNAAGQATENTTFGVGFEHKFALN